jgi:hypothetical protein
LRSIALGLDAGDVLQQAGDLRQIAVDAGDQAQAAGSLLTTQLLSVTSASTVWIAP